MNRIGATKSSPGEDFLSGCAPDPLSIGSARFFLACLGGALVVFCTLAALPSSRDHFPF